MGNFRGHTRLRGFGTVTSFRAPFLRFPSKFLSLLEDAGIVRDSSVAKYKGDYYRAPAPTRLLRIPVSITSSVLRLPRWIRDPWLLSLASPVVLFVHPWEFADLTRENLRFDCRFRTGFRHCSHYSPWCGCSSPAATASAGSMA